jgi:hypothetical protein
MISITELTPKDGREAIENSAAASDLNPLS